VRRKIVSIVSSGANSAQRSESAAGLTQLVELARQSVGSGPKVITSIAAAVLVTASIAGAIPFIELQACLFQLVRDKVAT
jgi:hypothetical protein